MKVKVPEESGEFKELRPLEFEFTEDASKQLDELRARAGAETNERVVLNSLRLLEWYLTKKEEGFNLALVREETKTIVREIDLTF